MYEKNVKRFEPFTSTTNNGHKIATVWNFRYFVPITLVIHSVMLIISARIGLDYNLENQDSLKLAHFSISLDFSTNLLTFFFLFLSLHPSILFDNLVPLFRVVPLDVRQGPLDLTHLFRGALRARSSQDEWRKGCQNEAQCCMLYTSE
jgi:hypothetical protein